MAFFSPLAKNNWFKIRAFFSQILWKLWLIGNRTSCRPIRSVIILVIKQIGLSLRGGSIFLMTGMITDRIYWTPLSPVAVTNRCFLHNILQWYIRPTEHVRAVDTSPRSVQAHFPCYNRGKSIIVCFSSKRVLQSCNKNVAVKTRKSRPFQIAWLVLFWLSESLA